MPQLHFQDVIVIVVLAGAALFVIVRRIRAARRARALGLPPSCAGCSGCSGGCANCPGRSASSKPVPRARK